MLNEPVRGQVPDPSLFALSGLEIVRAFMRGLVPPTPLFKLLRPRVTQASSGTAVMHQVLSPWLEVNEDFIDLTATSEYAITVTALTGTPPGSYTRTVNVSLRYLRPCTLENEMVIVRGRILHAGSNFTTVDALIEDALGRAVAHATGSVIVRAIDPPPPPLSRPLEPVVEPVYATPDPLDRPLDVSDEASDLPPFGRLLDAELVDVSGGHVTVAMPASEWFCTMHREVAPGIIGMLGNLAIRRAILDVIGAHERFVILNATITSLAPVIPDSRRLVAVASVRHRRDDAVLAEAEVTDADGRIVATIQGPCLIRDRSGGRQRLAQRRLLTVLFTDLVGSTERAQQLGDVAWGQLLDQHNAAVRRSLAAHHGREVKTTGDGVLATFDSPTQAVRCALAIRDAVARLGLQIRGGIHTGECELVGSDVAGLAVHLASRVQAAAQPGEILITSTVQDLIGSSDLRLADRGTHSLKGIDRPWTLLAVEH